MPKHLSLSRCLLFVAIVACRALFPGRCHAENSPDTNRVVVMISIDGLAGYYLDDPKADMPVIRKLAAEGCRASSMKVSAPSVTWPNHTTMVTGDHPARHGVIANNYYDRTTGKEAELITDTTFDKDQIVKVPTIYDAAKSAGMTTAAILWPATRNAPTLDWTIPAVSTNSLIRKYSTPELLKECREAGINVLRLPKSKTFSEQAGITRDDNYTRAFDLILWKHRPQLALLHVPNVDDTEHRYGPRTPEAYQAVYAADREVGMVWDELQRDFPGHATLIVVSDHGFSAISRMILPKVVLRKAGLLKRNRKSPVYVVEQGGAAFIYILDEARKSGIAGRVRQVFGGMDGIDKIIGPEDYKAYGMADPATDPHAPDLVVFAKEGVVFGDTAAGSLPYVEKPERKGSHGHDPSLPDLHATFVICGDGIQQGVNLGEINNIDVAPTIAKLLGISLPDTDGKPLAVFK